MSKHGPAFILLVKSPGKNINPRNGVQYEIEVEPGSIFVELSSSSVDLSLKHALKTGYADFLHEWSHPLYMKSVEINGLFLVAPKVNCSALKKDECNLLLGIAGLNDRFLAFSDVTKVQKAQKLKVGSVVDCCVPSDYLEGTKFRGTVRWIGELYGKRGTYFGVELTAPGAGNTDGTFDGRRYFQTGRNQAIFVGMDRLKLVEGHVSPRPTTAENKRKFAKQEAKTEGALSVGNSHFYADLDKWTDKILRKGHHGLEDYEEFVDWIKVEDQDSGLGSSLDGTSGNYAPNSTSVASAPLQNSLKALKYGDRIVWISALGKPEYGTVRWIGRLPGAPNALHAGIEFDHAIGGGTGRYHGRELFCTKPNHASLVPVIGLIRAEDFAPSDPRSSKEKDFMSTLERQRKHASPLQPKQNNLPISQSQTKSRSPAEESRKFSLATCVEVSVPGFSAPKYGVVKFFGPLQVGPSKQETMAGIELEEDLQPDWNLPTNGFFAGKQHFSCAPRRGIFLPASQLRPDRRFNTAVMSMHEFGSLDSGVITDYEPPGSAGAHSQLSITGKNRGVQGHRNSCYLDATLYAMFCHTNAFDRLLVRPENPSDIPQYSELRDLLAMEIVYPLRRNNYVRADHVVRFRQLLSGLLPDIAGLTQDEKDPEELLNALLGRLLKAPPFLHLRHGKSQEEAYLCQLLNDEDSAANRGVKVPTVQQLLENSFFHSAMKFQRIPSCLIVQLPRYGKQKIYQGIVPSLNLDLTHVMAESPRPCKDCKKLAEMECRECFLIGAESLADVSFCPNCFRLRHEQLPNQTNDHCPTFIEYSTVARSAIQKNRLPIPSVNLELVSVLCIETSHYVAFTRTGNGQNNWVLFDSMADRKGDTEGYNIPEVTSCPEIGRWLSPEGSQELRAVINHGKVDCLPKYLQRMLNDCYICFYVWPDGEMYGTPSRLESRC